MSVKLRVLLWMGLLLTACAQQKVPLPPNPCPEYFRYLRSGDQYIGKIALSEVSFGTLELEVTFSQLEAIESNFNGRLSFEHDLLTVQKDMESGKPISYRVDFPLPNVVPKLIQINVNNEEICSAKDYPERSISFSLRRSFSPKEGTQRIQKMPMGANAINPFFNPNTPQASSPSQKSTIATTDITETQSKIVPLPQDPFCGEMNNDTSPLTETSTELQRGHAPWLTAIYRKKMGSLQYVGGGTLISSRTVLTTAIIFQIVGLRAEDLLAYLGRFNLGSFSEIGATPREIQTLLIHPDFNGPNNEFSSDADIAILLLKSPVSFSEYIRPICLWNEDEEYSLIVAQPGYVVGWAPDANHTSVSLTPQLVVTSIISYAQCLRGMEIYREITSDRTFCAGSESGNTNSTASCVVDSGMGLMLNRNGRWTLRGLVSAGPKMKQLCGPRAYVVYCDVAKHIPWVRMNMVA